MSAWQNSAQWRPPQFGWFMRVEFAPFLAWVAPCILGLLLMMVDGGINQHAPTWPQRLDQLGMFDRYFSAALVYSPLWGFPAVIAAFPLRSILLRLGWFGWASALLAGALAGIAIPLMIGKTFWLFGPAYGAAYLFIQYVVYWMQYPEAFCVE